MVDVTTAMWFPNVTLKIVDSTGADAPVQGAPVWSSSDETILKAAPAADGMSGSISTVAPGTGRITVTADADIGAGVVTITGVSEDIVVTLDTTHQASVISMVLGAPAPKP